MHEIHQAERLETDKLRQLLRYEETRRCDLEGLLDHAHRQARDEKHEMQAQVMYSCPAEYVPVQYHATSFHALMHV